MKHSVYLRKVQKRRLPEAPRTAAAVDHHIEALIATTSQDGRHTHREHLVSLALALWSQPANRSHSFFHLNI